MPILTRDVLSAIDSGIIIACPKCFVPFFDSLVSANKSCGSKNLVSITRRINMREYIAWPWQKRKLGTQSQTQQLVPGTFCRNSPAQLWARPKRTATIETAHFFLRADFLSKSENKPILRRLANIYHEISWRRRDGEKETSGERMCLLALIIAGGMDTDRINTAINSTLLWLRYGKLDDLLAGFCSSCYAAEFMDMGLGLEEFACVIIGFWKMKGFKVSRTIWNFSTRLYYLVACYGVVWK